jgi:ribose 5-phosphate isomerase B
VRKGHTVVDAGGFSSDAKDDYPDFAKEVAHAVASDSSAKTKGILICGSGTGMVIAANKVHGIRAAFAYDPYSARMARHDNDANVLALRGRKFPAKTAAKLALIFLREPFSGIGRHRRRVRKVMALERGKRNA